MVVEPQLSHLMDPDHAVGEWMEGALPPGGNRVPETEISGDAGAKAKFRNIHGKRSERTNSRTRYFNFFIPPFFG